MRERKSIKLLVTAALLICMQGMTAQDMPVGEFGPPMDIPMFLSGNFGEFRTNHFHTGIDIKTQGVQGKNILSVEEGYVSRIKISPRGYGRALYIDHPNGYTSVYAHLKIFSESIEDFTRAKQYELEKWDIDYYPAPGELPVTRGELIALSGNSGSSRGPHLHFEIRETVTEYPINALKLGFEIKDEVKPTIQGLRVYPLDESARVSGGTEAKSFTVTGSKGKMKTTQAVIQAHGAIGLGLHTFDKLNGAENKNGIYSLSMQVNGVEYYAHTMDKLDFETFRYINTHKDYHLFKKKKWRYHKCFMSDNNALEIYTTLVNEGKLYISEGESMNVLFTAVDANGNISTLEALIKGVAGPEEVVFKEEPGIPFMANSDNVLRDEDLVLLVPQGRLYDDIMLEYTEVTAQESSLSKCYSVQQEHTPLQDKITVKIRPTRSFSDSTKLVMLDMRGGKHSIGGEFRDGWMEAKTRKFGTFCVGQDLKSPVIKSVEGLNPKSKRPNKITVRVSDNLSGLDSIRAEVDGQWFMMRHNTAKSWCSGTLSDLKLVAGEHVFTFYATDAVGNEVKKVVEFVTR